MSDKCTLPFKPNKANAHVSGPIIRYVTRDAITSGVTQACPISSGVVTYNYTNGAPSSQVFVNENSNKSIMVVSFSDITETQGPYTSVNIKFYNTGAGIINEQNYSLSSYGNPINNLSVVNVPLFSYAPQAGMLSAAIYC